MATLDDACRARACLALDGLSIGDAFGQHALRGPAPPRRALATRELPRAPWRWSDDTAMALALCGVLASHGRVEQDALAAAFAREYSARPDRGYGGVARWILKQIADGVPWREVARI